MKKVFIMRGASGSGKDYWVGNFIAKNSPINKISFIHEPITPVKVFSADNFFMSPEGIYNFNSAKLPEAHNQCLRDYAQEISSNLSDDICLIVNNTNIHAFEIAPYYRIAEAFGFEIEIIWIIAPLEVCKSRNVHKVPDYIINQQFSQLEPIPSWWNFQIILNP